MLNDAKVRWGKRLGLAAIAALSLGAATFGAAPAEARVWVTYPYYGPPAYYYPPPVAIAHRVCGWRGRWVRPHLNRWGRWVPGHCRPRW